MTSFLVFLVLMFVASTVTSSTVSTEKVSFDKDKYVIRRGGGNSVVSTSSSDNSGSKSSHRYLQKIKARNEHEEKDQLLSNYLNDDFVISNVANKINVNTDTERRMTTREDATNGGKHARSDPKTMMGKGKTGHIDNEFESICKIDVGT
jgi:hypothetical protein